MSEATFQLKVMVNKEKTKVLFAEIDNSFADVLLSFLALPLGTLVRILKKHYGDEAPAFGSLCSLYNGLANLDSLHFWTEGAKSILLHPRSSCVDECRRLKLNIRDPPPLEDFVCRNFKKPHSHRFESVSMYYDHVASCIICHRCPVKREMAERDGRETRVCNDEVFTVSRSFVITDDLQIVSNAMGLLQIATSFGVTDIDNAEQINAVFGFDEVMNLLKASLVSSTPLSDVVLKKTVEMRKFEQGTLTNHALIHDKESSNSMKMVLKLTVQKSTNKLLYAQAEKDFVEFLFSFLIIPLGGVESLLESNAFLKSIDNFYTSISAGFINDKYFKHPEAKNRLINPKIPHGYISKTKHILPLIEEELPSFYEDIELFSSLKFPQGRGNYLKEPATFMVSDDLTVTPFCIASALSFLKEMKVSVSDVMEVEVQIGMKEALGILKASLTTSSALSNGLMINHVMNLIQPKHEYYPTAPVAGTKKARLFGDCRLWSRRRRGAGKKE